VRARTVLVSLGAVVALALMGPAGIAGASSAVPYSDPSVVGYIGLCNQAGQQITSGNINTVPFAWRAVSSQPAPAPYNNSYRTAILMAYQPIQELAPGEWSGEQMTASSRYTNPTNPMAAATDGDDSLADFISDFPMKWDNFIQLRMYLGTANAQQYSLHYPALDVQVTGDTWQAVDGGPVNCAAGTAESIESIVLPSSTTTTVPVAAGHTAATTPATSTGGSHATSATTVPGGTPAGHHEAVPAPTSAHSTSSDDGPLIAGLVVAGLAVVAVLGYLVARRRRRTSGPAGSTVDRSSPPDSSPPARTPEASMPAGSSSSRSTSTKGH
jgi:hypothetical protein